MTRNSFRILLGLLAALALSVFVSACGDDNSDSGDS